MKPLKSNNGDRSDGSKITSVRTVEDRSDGSKITSVRTVEDRSANLPPAPPSSVRAIDAIAVESRRWYALHQPIVADITDAPDRQALRGLNKLATDLQKEEQIQRDREVQLKLTLAKKSLQLRQAICDKILVYLLYPVFEALREESAEAKQLGTINCKRAIDYVKDTLMPLNFGELIDNRIYFELATLFEEGDWHSREGLKSLRRNLYEILDLELPTSKQDARDTVPDIEYAEVEEEVPIYLDDEGEEKV